MRVGAPGQDAWMEMSTFLALLECVTQKRITTECRAEFMCLGVKAPIVSADFSEMNQKLGRQITE